MSTETIATTAGLIGERTRAAMLAELLGGHALTSTELAVRAHITPPTASVHLAKLVEGGLLAVEVQGRHRYYRLAGVEVARVLEELGGLSASPERAVPPCHSLPEGLRFARTCYDHLAGKLAVAIRDALLEREIVQEAGIEHLATERGGAWLTAFGVDVAAARRARRSFARRCLDWTERRPHLAGALGAALLDRLVERGWLVRQPGERTVLLTRAGAAGFSQELGFDF
ncbi:MAG TPA: winged helix-turn-helix domain-containing protein [Chloroflexota bacterium]|nr:winged helix-turn-helix domain-containing protein [Chloroflexota bacterium]